MTDIYHTISIDINNANQRFDRFLRKLYKPYTTVTLPTIYSWIRKGYIRINDKKAKEETKIVLGDSIIINVSKTIPLLKTSKQQKTNHDIQQEKQTIQKNIIFEDDNRLVFNKPPHILMHPGSGIGQKAVTMNDWLYSYLNLGRRDSGTETITAGSTFKPSFCYRLDKDTSGVLIAAKKYDALQYLNDAIRERNVTKRYVVVVQGKLPKKLHIDKPLFKGFHGEKGRAHMFVNYEKGLPSQTYIYHLADTKIDKVGIVSLGLVRLLTGRMHQIRVHSASEGFPVLGDKDYGTEGVTRIIHKKLGISRQLLHSYSYTFYDIYSKSNKVFFATLPEDIKKIFGHIDEKTIQGVINNVQ